MNTKFAYYFVCAIILFSLLTGVYLLTYRGFPLSADEYFIYDITESLVNRDDFYRTYEFSKFNDSPLSGEPWAAPNQEPLISIAIAPFFWLGQNLPDTGTMHVTWLFNIFLTAITSVSVFIAALLLRYPPRIAWIAGLLYGLSTLAWPYSRHLFREPLMAFFTLWCFVLALMIQKSWQGNGRFSWGIGIALIACFVGAFLTKAASILLLPGLFIVLFPPVDLIKKRARLLGILGIFLLLLVLAVIIIINLDADVRSRYSLDFWERQLRAIQWKYLWESFLGYQFSIGRSLWLHSPILLLGIIGIRQLIKQKRWRTLLGPIVFIVLLSASYGIAHKTSWWGSWGWGPRYMLPLTSVLLIYWVLPVLADVKTKAQHALWLSLATLGAGIQFLGISVPLPNYYTDLNWAGILIDWKAQPDWAAYNWSWEWSPIAYHLRRFDLQHLDIAWLSAEPGWLGPLLAAIVIIISAFLCIHLLKTRSIKRSAYVATAILPPLAFFAIAGGLHSLRDDPRYIGQWQDVNTLISTLNEQVDSDQVVFIDREQYLLPFLNNFKAASLTAILPYAPGEIYGPDDPQVISNDLVEQVGEVSVYALDWTADRYDQLWLVASSGPFEQQKIRPIERYLVENYFPVNEITITQQARAVRFLTIDVPQGEPSHRTDIVFDDKLALIGYDLPAGTEFAPGDIVPVSLLWSPVESLPEDYSVSVQIVGSDGIPIAQRDGTPQATFGHMSQWQIGENYRDNHGLQLPSNIASGHYVLQVIVYRWQDGQRLYYTNTESSGDIMQLSKIVIAGE